MMMMKMPIMIIMNHPTKRNKNKRKIVINLQCQTTIIRKIGPDKGKGKNKIVKIMIKMLINSKGKVNNK